MRQEDQKKDLVRPRSLPWVMYVASAGIWISGAVNLDRDSSSIDVEKVGEYPGLSQITRSTQSTDQS